MAQQEPSIAELLRTAIRDAQDLVRGEVALVKAELKEEARRIGTGVTMLAAAAITGIVALILLMTTAALGVSAALGWATWLGFAAVTGLMLLVTAVLAGVGRSRLASGRHLPKTMATMKENTEWIRARTS